MKHKRKTRGKKGKKMRKLKTKESVVAAKSSGGNTNNSYADFTVLIQVQWAVRNVEGKKRKKDVVRQKRRYGKAWNRKR